MLPFFSCDFAISFVACPLILNVERYMKTLRIWCRKLKLFTSSVVLSFVAFNQLVIAESQLEVGNRAVPLERPEGQPIRLLGDDILKAFSNVRDDAEVQNIARTRAINYWYADGRFVSRWWHARGSGEVVGVWRVRDDLRCVTIISGLPNAERDERCSAISRLGDKFQSLNPDGSIHGLHTLSDIDQSAN